MLTIKQIINYTRAYKPLILQKARSVSVRFYKPKVQKDKDGDEFTLVTASCRGDTTARRVEIRRYGKGEKARVWVSCDCEWFLFHCEKALELKDSSDIIHSNGAMPEITNSRTIPAACKHILGCFIQGAANL